MLALNAHRIPDVVLADVDELKEPQIDTKTVKTASTAQQVSS
jgi:hypothetical protein